MKIAVISQVRAGHVTAYHRLFVEEFQAVGCEVLDLGSPLPEHGWGRMIKQLERWPWWRGRRAWHQASRRLSRHPNFPQDREVAVFFPYLDVGYLEAAISAAEVERWMPCPWAGVVTGPAALRQPGRFVAGERVLAARNCRTLVVTDETFVEACRNSWPGKPVVVMPEVADLALPVAIPEIASVQAWVGGRRLVGLLGVISAKKNIALFLLAARRALIMRPDLAFVLAGDFSSQACPGPERRALEKLLADLPSNCRFYPAPIPDGPQFNAWVTACDCLWLAYHDVIYKSNMLTKAAHFQRPVLVSPTGVMAVHTLKYRLGEVVDPENPDQVLAALGRMTGVPEVGRSYAEFAAINGRPQLADTVRAVLSNFHA